ncbi:hypothetical protein K1Y78_47715 [Streptomyces sp. tea 10]|nr:hypothetical protein [Streptomyces sp. tea 10]
MRVRCARRGRGLEVAEELAHPAGERGAVHDGEDRPAGGAGLLDVVLVELGEGEPGGGVGAVAPVGGGQRGECPVGGGFRLGRIADDVPHDRGQGEQFRGPVEGDPCRPRPRGVRLRQGVLGPAQAVQRGASVTAVGETDGGAGVGEGGVQRAAPGDGGCLRCLSGGHGFGVPLALAGEHRPQVPALHGHLGILREAREGEGVVEVLAGVVQQSGVDQGPRSGRGEVRGQCIQALSHALRGRLRLEAECFVGAVEGGFGEGAVPAALCVERDQALDVLAEPDHVAGPDTLRPGGGWGSGGEGGGRGAGGRAQELATEHVVLRWCWSGRGFPAGHEP